MNLTLAASISLALSLAAFSSLADEQSDVSTHLQQQEQLEQRIKILERNLELKNESASTDTPLIKAAPNGFSIASADGGNIVKLRGTLSIDGRYFTSFDDTANLTNNVVGTSAYKSADGFLLRKVRPYFEGTLNGIYDWRFQPEFSGGRTVVLDAYVAARLQPWLIITAGKFKNPIGLERLQTEQYNKFVELGFPSALFPNRDIGLQLSGMVANGALHYAAGIYNGTIDGGSSDNNPTADADSDGKREFAARIFTLPFTNSNNYYLRGLAIGIAGSVGSKQGNADVSTRGSSFSTSTQIISFVSSNTWLPTYRTAAQQAFFSYRGDNADTMTLNEAAYANGDHTRWSPQAYYYYGSLGIIAEYAESKQQLNRHLTSAIRSALITNKAWQVAASYFLTGEDAAYNSATPRRNFAIGKTGLGAWEVALRYQRLSIDGAAFASAAAANDSFANPATAVRSAIGYSATINWSLNQNVRWSLEYDHTKFTGGAGISATASVDAIVVNRKPEKAFVTRFALAF
jgi:phosphate-selective porin OprO and OprP